MATTRFKFRASSVSGKQGTLFIQVIHKRVARQVNTSYRLYPNEGSLQVRQLLTNKIGFVSPERRYEHTLVVLPSRM